MLNIFEITVDMINSINHLCSWLQMESWGPRRLPRRHDVESKRRLTGIIDLDSPCHKPTKVTTVWDGMGLVGLPQYGILGQKIACLHNNVLFDYYTTAILLAQPSSFRISAKVPAPKAAMASLGRWPLSGVQGLQQWMVDAFWGSFGNINHYPQPSGKQTWQPEIPNL